MAQTVLFSKTEKGFSLIEILISLLLMQLVLITLMATAVIITQTSMRNRLRDVAVTATQDQINSYRSMLFTDARLNPGTTTTTVQRRLGETMYNFNMSITVAQDGAAPDFKTIQILTTWTFLSKNNSPNYSHAATLIVKL